MKWKFQGQPPLYPELLTTGSLMLKPYGWQQEYSLSALRTLAHFILKQPYEVGTSSAPIFHMRKREA